ncbi:MAG: DUF1223 domain-containing protein [Paracoccus sp. (in: a-proteobacteria)]|nr:DUF1223 domain-containing protein [Paracoccus sp. (in: a-proteobacteria)]
MIGDQQMRAMPGFCRGDGPLGAVVMTVAGLFLTVGAAIAQPIILAPDDPGRMVPSLSEALESGGFSNFSATDVAPPTADLPSATQPVVVELFTSQGCSSCPPADAMLSMLAEQPDVLPLSYHVDYWDYLGWADSFAKPEFTERQEAYARAAGERSVYTPQMIVGGSDTAVAPGPTQLMGLVDGRRFAPTTISVVRDKTPEGEKIELAPLSELGDQIDIVLVRYAPERKVDVTEGENRGRTIVYTNVVLALQHLATWDGTTTMRLNVRPENFSDARFGADTRHVLLAQQMVGKKRLPGPILTAIPLD